MWCYTEERKCRSRRMMYMELREGINACYIRRLLPYSRRSFKRIGKIAQDARLGSESRWKCNEWARTSLRYFTFSSRIYLRVLHTRMRRRRRKAGIIQCKHRERRELARKYNAARDIEGRKYACANSINGDNYFHKQPGEDSAACQNNGYSSGNGWDCGNLPRRSCKREGEVKTFAPCANIVCVLV